MRRIVATLVALLFVAMTAACSSTPAAEAHDLTVTLEAAPPGGAYLIAVVTDADGSPVTDATVALEGNMNHAGMVPVFSEAVRDDADGAADGRYRVPFEFTMLGDWIITVTVARADAGEATTDIELNVADSGVTIE